jgi:cyclophilin family peptidyl-prolyl cis-trans isomerase
MNGNRINRLVLILAIGASFAIAPALADRTDPDLIPPDVTLTQPSAGGVPAATGAAPGLATPGPTVSGMTSQAAAGLTGGAVPGMAGLSLPPGASTLNGFAVPKSGRVTATISKPPGTQFGMGQGGPPPGSGALPTSGNGLYQGSGNPVDPNQPDPIARIDTAKGSIKIRLFRQYAPKTVDNFMDLVSRGFYNGLCFHRVEPGFCIQGGDPNGNGSGIFLDPQTHQARFLPLEASPNLKHNAPGVVAMAHSQSLDSGSCQFYITLASEPTLDNQYTIFGGVIEGMNVVNSIQKGDKIMSISLLAQ